MKITARLLNDRDVRPLVIWFGSNSGTSATRGLLSQPG
jgi:hypothetical protein